MPLLYLTQHSETLFAPDSILFILLSDDMTDSSPTDFAKQLKKCVYYSHNTVYPIWCLLNQIWKSSLFSVLQFMLIGMKSNMADQHGTRKDIALRIQEYILRLRLKLFV